MFKNNPFISKFFLLALWHWILVFTILQKVGWQQNVSGHFNLILVLVSNSFRNFYVFLVVYSGSPTISQNIALWLTGRRWGWKFDHLYYLITRASQHTSWWSFFRDGSPIGFCIKVLIFCAWDQWGLWRLDYLRGPNETQEFGVVQPSNASEARNWMRVLFQGNNHCFVHWFLNSWNYTKYDI